LDRIRLANIWVWLFFGFSGRVSRAAYVPAGLLLYLARFYPVYRIIAAGGVEGVETFWGGALLIVVGATLVCHIALAAKRLHDMDQSGWWSLLFLIGDFLAYLILCFVPGTRGTNRYGARTDAPA
jgi:uncharacterized membrane protein YhaH (DUF805 family)